MLDPQFFYEDLAEGKSPKQEDGLGAVGILGRSLDLPADTVNRKLVASGPVTSLQ